MAGYFETPGIAQVKRQSRVSAFQEQVGGHTGNLPVGTENQDFGHGSKAGLVSPTNQFL